MPESPSSVSDLERLTLELSQRTVLVQQVREELIKSQIMVLELQDTILQKETDKADAVSLLGQAELVLEGKINYIFELDRVLNGKITQLEKDRAGMAAGKLQLEAVVQDLVQKLDLVNRDLGAAHQLAGKYAQEAASAREEAAAATRADEVAATKSFETSAALASVKAEAAQLRIESNEAAAKCAALSSELSEIRNSLAWKITKPLRALFRSKS